MNEPGPWVTRGSKAPDCTWRVTAMWPLRTTVRPCPGSPMLVTNAPGAKDCTCPKRRTRSSSAALSSGNTCCRRVSKMDGGELVAMTLAAA